MNTHVAAATAAMVWLLVERIKIGKSTTVGFATGAIAGLATITPAAGSVSPGGAIIIGLLAGVVCYFMIGLVKNTFKIDDSLDVFAVHGVGGILGSLLVALFVSDSFGGTGYADGMNLTSQLGVQAGAVAIVAIWSAIATLIIGYAVSMVLPMRVTEDEERDGLDIASHGERAWDLD